MVGIVSMLVLLYVLLTLQLFSNMLGAEAQFAYLGIHL